jgi:ATPase subunit of ABC transporter with duplicated ATPase domains
MVGVSKFYDKKPVLKDIYLSYFYGAKIGVIGLNGSGKSSLLRILAGVDKDFNGETVISPGFTVGYLEQEPLIDDSRTVREVVEEAVKETVDLLKEYEEINAKFGEEMSDDEMSSLLERQGEVQEKLDAADAWDLDSRLEMAMDALRCPAPDTPVKVLSGGERSVVCCFKSPTFSCSTSLRTILTRSQWRGSNTIYKVMRERSSPSLTIDIFSTTSPVGFSN